MQSACWCAAMCLQRVGTAAVWIRLRRTHELLSCNRTQTHTLALFSRVCITSEECFQGDFLCADRTHTKARPDLDELPHTQALGSRRSVSGFPLQSLPGPGTGGANRAKSFTCAQHKHTHTHAHTDGLDINNTWAKPLKSSSSRELLEWINLVPAEGWCTINSKSSITRVIMHNKTNQNRKQFHPGDPLLKHSTLNFAKARTAWCQMKQSR